MEEQLAWKLRCDRHSTSRATRGTTCVPVRFRFRTHGMRVFDETRVYPGALVTAVIDNRRRPVWQRTDIATGANGAD
jgi:hypothetical protein